MAWTPLPEVVETLVETPQPKEFVLDPAKTAICIVDMQNYFCMHGNQRAFDVIEGNKRLLEKARAAGAKVLYVQSVRWPESPNWTVYHRKLTLLPGTKDVEVVADIAPMPGENVIQKWSHDVWAWYGMEAVLEKEGIVAGEWTVLVTGVSAASCAEAAAFGFANRLYRTLIPLDCTAAGIEQETRTFSHYQSRGYNHIMDFTLSTMVSFESPVATDAPLEVAAAV
jgi:ureidoacrylate peracid hydrolase